jgi:hypothetical protein
LVDLGLEVNVQPPAVTHSWYCIKKRDTARPKKTGELPLLLMLTATAARVVVAVADRREVAVPLGALASSQFRVQRREGGEVVNISLSETEPGMKVDRLK